jgi:hypothetical protein
MDILTQIPIGTKFRIIKTGEIVTLEEIRNYPTRFKTVNDLGRVEYYKTFEIEIIESTNQDE